jgi:hypothetical protein
MPSVRLAMSSVAFARHMFVATDTVDHTRPGDPSILERTLNPAGRGRNRIGVPKKYYPYLYPYCSLLILGVVPFEFGDVQIRPWTGHEVAALMYSIKKGDRGTTLAEKREVSMWGLLSPAASVDCYLVGTSSHTR